MAALTSLPAGPELLAELVALAPDDLSPRERLETAEAWKRMLCLCQAGQLDAVAALDRTMPPDPASPSAVRPAATELAAAMVIAPAAASRMVGLARRLANDLPATADALADGLLDLPQVLVVASTTAELPDLRSVRAGEALAVREGRRRTVRQLRTCLEAEAMRRDPEWAHRRAQEGVRQREVVVVPSPVAGLLTLRAQLPAVAATACWNVLDALARGPRAREDDRTLANRRADALAGLVTGAVPVAAEGGIALPEDVVDAVPGPDVLARLAEVQVVVSAESLRGATGDPGELVDVLGGCVVDAGTARDLAGDARWRRLVADPLSGTLVDVASTTYRPPPRLRRHLVVRDGTCRGPVCSVPASRCQVDHTTNFGEVGPDGEIGATAAHNTGCLCARDHNAKTHGGARLSQPSPGTFVWDYPTGRRYVVQPRPLLPAWRREDLRADPGRGTPGRAAPGPPPPPARSRTVPAGCR